MKIALASDHRGYKLKQELIENLKQNYEVTDLGTTSEESTDFPIYGIKLGETIKENKETIGIAICGTGIGISIAANKVKGIMCAKINSKEEALEMIYEFLNAKEIKEEKYIRRIEQIRKYENGN